MGAGLNILWNAVGQLVVYFKRLIELIHIECIVVM